jgi:predicted nucleic acid-binding protein
MAIVDTNILSYGIQGAALSFTYARLLADYDVRISFITAAEFHYGAEKRRWSQRRRLADQRELRVLPPLRFGARPTRPLDMNCRCSL